MRHLTTLALITVALNATSSWSQDGFEPTPPLAEHEWLRQFVGEWTTSSQGTAGPDQPAFECSGSISSRMLGGYWVVNDMSSDVVGTQMRGLQTIGYDSQKQKYIGTWVDSIMNYMWHYEGVVDESGKKLTLYAEGPNFAGGEGTAMFRDSYEFVDEDHILITSEMQGEGGEWITFMTGEAHRSESPPSDE